MSDVLRLSCSIENERVRSATRDFASTLESLFELHRNIVEKYLKLVKYCEDANIMCPLLVSELEEWKDKDVGKSEPTKQATNPATEAYNQVLKQNTKTPFSTSKNLSAVCTPDLDFQSDGILLSDSNSEYKVNSESELLKSPVLIKKRLRTRRNDSTPNRSGLANTSGSSEHTSVDLDTPTSRDKSKENKLKLSTHVEEDNNNDEIENTPVPKKLGVSKLYHVDTTLLQSGRKLKQSKLVLLPLQEDTDITASKRCSNLESSSASTTLIRKKSSHKLDNSDKRQDKPLDEDIIESSPRSAEAQLKMKNRLKLKRTSPKKHARNRPMSKNSTKPDGERSSSSVLSKPLTDITFANLSQLSPPIHSSTQREEPQLIRRLRTVCTLSSDKGYIGSAGLQESEERGLGVETCDLGTQKRKLSESLCEDETFFSFKERDKKEDFGVRTSDFDEEFTIVHAKSSSPPAKRSLMTSFDIVPSKKENKLNYANRGKPGRSKADRAKMDGRSCWECKKYYENLGLSEKEIQMRQNQCSRHRTTSKQVRQSTPEGFWDPVFPDTQSSTLQYN